MLRSGGLGESWVEEWICIEKLEELAAVVGVCGRLDVYKTPN